MSSSPPHHVFLGSRLARRLFALFVVAALVPLALSDWLSTSAVTQIAESLSLRSRAQTTRQTSRQVFDRLMAGKTLLAAMAASTQATETSWLAANGWMDAIRPNATFERISLNEHPRTVAIEDGAGLFKRTVNESTKMSAWGLRDYIAQLKSIGVSTLDLQIDLNKRLAFPFSCLTLSVLAIPFITIKQGRRSGPLMSVAISVCIGLVFWLLMTLFEAAGKQSTLPATIAVWAPQILFGAIGLFLIFFRHRTQ